jgi:hypothetical protein
MRRAGASSPRPVPWLVAATSIALLMTLHLMWYAPATAAEARANRIKIEYFTPDNPAYIPIKNLLQQHRALETLQELFSPFRLPIDLTLRTGDCRGVANAWYDRPAISICYEYVAEMLRGLPPQEKSPNGITRTDAAIGQFFYVIAHEMGHAAFDLFEVPIFGNEEVAADHFSTFIMLHFGKDQARRLIAGAAHSFHRYVQNARVTAPLAAFSEVHGPPAQRFFNLLCLAYGADPVLFADFVDKGYLPKTRAIRCKREYDQVAFAFRDLITPHIDQELAKRVLNTTWLPEPKARSSMN